MMGVQPCLIVIAYYLAKDRDFYQEKGLYDPGRDKVLSVTTWDEYLTVLDEYRAYYLAHYSLISGKERSWIPAMQVSEELFRNYISIEIV